MKAVAVAFLMMFATLGIAKPKYPHPHHKHYASPAAPLVHRHYHRRKIYTYYHRHPYRFHQHVINHSHSPYAYPMYGRPVYVAPGRCVSVGFHF